MFLALPVISRPKPENQPFLQRLLPSALEEHSTQRRHHSDVALLTAPGEYTCAVKLKYVIYTPRAHTFHLRDNYKLITAKFCFEHETRPGLCILPLAPPPWTTKPRSGALTGVLSAYSSLIREDVNISPRDQVSTHILPFRTKCHHHHRRRMDCAFFTSHVKLINT